MARIARVVAEELPHHVIQVNVSGELVVTVNLRG